MGLFNGRKKRLISIGNIRRREDLTKDAYFSFAAYVLRELSKIGIPVDFDQKFRAKDGWITEWVLGDGGKVTLESATGLMPACLITCEIDAKMTQEQFNQFKIEVNKRLQQDDRWQFELNEA